MATVLINNTVKRYLLNQPLHFREKLRDKFEFLETGIWEGRLRAKKLRGISSKCVFEAPVDRDSRLLFTLGKYGEAPEKNLVVHVWGIASNDELSKKSRNIVPRNAPFLEFHDFDELSLEDVDLDELEPSCFTQEKITEKTGEESGSQRWFAVDEPEWQRIRNYAKDDFELPLCLTPGQREVLESPPPILVSGTAGSGKTTLSVYYLLKRDLNRRKKIFITYNPTLRNFAERLCGGLLNEAKQREEFLIPDFRVYKQFILDVARRFGRNFLPKKEVDFNRFSRMFASHPLCQKFDAALVWEEIRSIIKGALPQVNISVLERAYSAIRSKGIDPGLFRRLQEQFVLFSKLESLKAVGNFVGKYLKTSLSSFSMHLDRYLKEETSQERVLQVLDRTLHLLKRQKEVVHKKHLSFLEYELLGKKKAPNFRFNRKEIYQIFEWYQDRLEKNSLWDELDLTREVLSVSSEKGLGDYTYDMLACDEVQDLTDIQIGLLFELVASQVNVFFAGDTKQVINPSGFRWEEIKRQFYERGLEVPELRFLTLNFRSSGSIVELSNVLLELKEKYLGLKAEEVPEEWKYKGRPVTVISGIEEPDMIEILRAAGARRTILVRTEKEKKRLQKLLGTELVFTIAEAKGLEFDTVVLWKFCEDELVEDVWKIILDMSKRSVHEAKIRHEINILYVGITRSLNDLIVYDGKEPSLIWENQQFGNRVYVTGDRSFISGIWNVLTTPEEWIGQGDYFFEKEFYRAAMECYKNGGETGLFHKASAHALEKAGKYGEAAQHFEKIGDQERAAQNYERAGDFRKALPLWEKLKNEDGAFRCQVEVFKKEGEHRKAGDLYLGRGMVREAVPCFKKSGDFLKLAEIYLEHLNRIREAADCLEQAHEYERAAGLYFRLKSYEKAAGLYWKAGNSSRAEALWKKTKNDRRLMELYEKTGQEEKLLSIYEKQKDFEKITKCLRSFKDKAGFARDAEKFFGQRKYFLALTRFAVLEDHQRMGECYFRLKSYGEAARHFRLAGDYLSAGKAWEKDNEFKRAVEHYLDSEEDRKKGFPLARKAVRNVPDDRWIYQLGKDLFDRKRYREASVLFSVFSNAYPEVGICWAMLGEEKKAFEAWSQCEVYGDYGRLADMCLYSDAVGTAAKFFLTRQQKILYRLEWETRQSLENSRVVDLMDAYFSANPDADEMRSWGNFLCDLDTHGVMWEKILNYLERSGGYNLLLDYFRMLNLLEKKRFRAAEARFKKEIPVLVRSKEWGALAFRYHVLGRDHDFNRTLPKIKITAHNYLLFLAGEETFYRKGLVWCEENDLLEEASAFFPMMGTYERTAEIFEKTGNLGKAADYYAYSRRFDKAAALYNRLKRFAPAGDAFYKMRDYRNALKMYQKQSPPNKKKIARSLEMMGELDKALKLWEELKDRKSAARCRAKMEKAKQRKIRFPSSA
jgi:tetratricopeptide (TPR) repeat protein